MPFSDTPPAGPHQSPQPIASLDPRVWRNTLFALFSLPLLSTLTHAAVPVIEDPGVVTPGVIELITATDVSLQIIASDNPTSYGATGLPSGLSIDSATGMIEGDLDDPITAAVTLTATNGEGTGNLPVTIKVFEREPNLPSPTTSSNERLEDAMEVDGAEMAPFTQSPCNPVNHYFFRQSGIGEDSDALRNRANLDNNIAVGVRTYVQGPAQITFSWWCDIETNFDFFSFYIDQDPVPPPNPGELLEQAGRGDVYLTGDVAPVDYTTVVGPGLHRLEWIYSRDYNDAAGGDELCYLDNLRIVGLPVWAENKNLSVFESDYRIDKDLDGNCILMEYALDLDPRTPDNAQPLLSFEPDGRAIVEIGRYDQSVGVNVDIEKMNLSPPGTFPPLLETLVDTPALLRKRETSPQPKGLYRVNVTAP